MFQCNFDHALLGWYNTNKRAFFTESQSNIFEVPLKFGRWSFKKRQKVWEYSVWSQLCETRSQKMWADVAAEQTQLQPWVKIQGGHKKSQRHDKGSENGLFTFDRGGKRWDEGFDEGNVTFYCYDLLNVLYGCKMALPPLDFSQVKPTIAMLRERWARAPEAAWARFPWCDRKARRACFAVTHLRYYVVMGPWKQRPFHRYSYYRANSVTYPVVSI